MSDIKSFIHRFVQSEEFQDPERKAWFLLAYGAYMTMNEELDNLVNELTHNPDDQWSTGQLLIFQSNARLLRDMPNRTFREAKESIRTYVMESDVVSKRIKPLLEYSDVDCEEYNTRAEESAKRMLRSMREHQYEHSLLESAMVNAAPIVPYNEEMIALPPFQKQDLAPTLRATVVDPPEEQSYNSYSTMLSFALKYPLDLLRRALDSTVVFSITDEMVANGEFPSQVDEYLLQSTDDPGDIQIHLYYLICTLRALGYQYDQMHGYFDTFVKLSESNSLDQVFEAMYERTSKVDPTYIAKEAWEALDFEKEQAVEEILHKANDHDPFHTDKHVFDLDAMMAYIYNHREIYCNTYANTFFMTEAKNLEINNLNYMAGNILLAEVNSAYLVCPFMDLSRDRDIRLLCMNKDQQIFIQDSFEFATDPVVPETE